ncbi:hypothetical protein MMC17_005782 [Xylographa soralifera]|nr:hypothetical protein [Xylographa soralifera]
MNTPDILNLLRHSFHRNVTSWEVDKAELRLPIAICGRRFWSLTEMDTGQAGGYDSRRTTLADLNTAASCSGFAIRVETSIHIGAKAGVVVEEEEDDDDDEENEEDIDYVEQKATHDLDFVGGAHTEDINKGMIVVLSAKSPSGAEPDLEAEHRYLATYLEDQRVKGFEGS